MAKKARPLVLFLLLYIGFLSTFFVFGAGVYNDSDQYIRMHIHREPLYPLFLAGLRAVWPEEESWLTAMGVLQNLFAAFSICAMAEYVARRFRLRFWQEGAVVFLGVMPYVTTMFFSSLHLLIPNSVMSEAVCLPFFMLFMLECFKIVLERDRRAVRRASAASLLLAFLLSLARSQMMLAILMWLVVTGAEIMLSGPSREKERKGGRRGKRIAEDGRRPVQAKREAMPVPGGNASDWEEAAAVKRIRRKGRGKSRSRKRIWRDKVLRLLLAVTLVFGIFSLRTLAVRSYNLVFNGHFINNTYGTVNTLTNVLYAADREDGERIEDEEARVFFYRMYDLTEERQANYKYAGKSLREKTEHIEAWHDTVKYEMIEDVFYQYYDKNVTSDYIYQNLMADEAAGKIMRGILPGCFLRWCGNYLLIVRYGLVRSIAVVHPLLNWAAAFIYLSAFGMMCLAYHKDRRSPAVRLMAVSLLAVAANVAAVSLTIMCLSRYMVYGFVPFYIGYFLLVLECFGRYGKEGRKVLAGRLGRNAFFVAFRGRGRQDNTSGGIFQARSKGKAGEGDG